MLIPSIDIMGGKAVQLRRGKDLVLTSDRDPLDLAREFNRYGEVAVIDLDAALGKGDNLDLVRRMCAVADVRAGGGIRTAQRGLELLKAGARRIIVGTAAEPEFLSKFPRESVMAALDHDRGTVLDRGWTRSTGEPVAQRAARLAPYCCGFLVTFVDREGGLGGLDPKEVADVTAGFGRPVTAAGGVADTDGAAALVRAGFDVQVGMSLYTGKLDPGLAVVRSMDFDKSPLVPTIAQDEAGQVLMLAHSTPESLEKALREGVGAYWSRSRSELWVKGATSGNTQELIRCRHDCDRDALLFTVRQKGPACHTGAYSCFQGREFGLETLFGILRSRKEVMPEGSYTAKMFRDREKLVRKLMEEAFETATAKDRRNLVWELADLLYFASVLAVSEGISLQEIEAELGGRHRS